MHHMHNSKIPYFRIPCFVPVHLHINMKNMNVPIDMKKIWIMLPTKSILVCISMETPYYCKTAGDIIGK